MRRQAAAAVAALGLLAAAGCRREAALVPTRFGATGLGENPLRGDLVPVHDPALARGADGRWYAWTTDLPFEHAPGFVQVRCSNDGRLWQRCGHVFSAMPGWIGRAVPGAVGLWAPEIARFGGRWWLYYAASALGSQRSAIGVATAAGPQGPWEDRGEVLGSRAGDRVNAIDPSLLVENGGGGGQVWMAYGSFWDGIFVRAVDPSTGKLVPGAKPVRVAAQPKSRGRAIEGAALLKRGGWYYLFASVGACCEIPIERDTYREIVGRSRRVEGPYLAEDGGPMLAGGGTVLLASNSQWLAPGGGAVWADAGDGQVWMAFHALKRSENGALYLWVEELSWREGWPVLLGGASR